MKKFFSVLAVAALGASLFCIGSALAGQDDHGHDDHGHGAPAAGSHVAPEGHGDAAHGEGHGDHAPTFHDINWGYGFLGEKEGAAPSLLWRPKGMPVPFGALALNAAILYWLLIKFGKKPISDALKARKLGIMKGMDHRSCAKEQACLKECMRVQVKQCGIDQPHADRHDHQSKL